MAITNAKVIDLRSIPRLIPFTEERSLSFCSFPSKASKVVNIASIVTEGTKVFLNNWNPMVNTVDTQRSRFEGWISIRGIPFEDGTKKTLNRKFKWMHD